jgi:integrase
LEGRPLAGITREELQQLLCSKAATHSASVVNHLRFTLRAIFDLAISDQAATFNPASELYTPRECQAGRERKVLDESQATLMLDVFNLREECIARLALFAGMRPGEILGLQVRDVREHSVSVERRLYRGIIDTPKSNRSAREVALPSMAADTLQRWISTLQDQSPNAWVFPAENLTTPIWRDNTWYRNMKPCLEKAGLEWATFQVMRRSWATWGKRQGGARRIQWEREPRVSDGALCHPFARRRKAFNLQKTRELRRVKRVF